MDRGVTAITGTAHDSVIVGVLHDVDTETTNH